MNQDSERQQLELIQECLFRALKHRQIGAGISTYFDDEFLVLCETGGEDVGFIVRGYRNVKTIAGIKYLPCWNIGVMTKRGHRDRVVARTTSIGETVIKAITEIVVAPMLYDVVSAHLYAIEKEASDE